MQTPGPLVSIGLPVYNEERFLPLTLDSLVQQDYPHLEIIISDNASTDRTGEICANYAQQDSRIRYYHNTENIGSIENFHRVFVLSHGEYFMWAGAHDLRDSNFVSACLTELREQPNTVLSSGRYNYVDENGRFLGDVPVHLDLRGKSPSQRFRTVLYDPLSCLAIYGLIRAEALRQAGTRIEVFFQDFVLVAKLALLGEFSFSANSTTHLRTFSVRDLMDKEDENLKVTRLLSPARAHGRLGLMMKRFPFLQFTLEICRTLYASSLSLEEKLKLTLDAPGRWKGNVFRELTTRWIPKRARKIFKTFLIRKSA